MFSLSRLVWVEEILTVNAKTKNLHLLAELDFGLLNETDLGQMDFSYWTGLKIKYQMVIFKVTF